MRGHESLRLPGPLEFTHPSLSYPGRFMQLLGSVICVLFSSVDRLGHQLTMCNTLASQLTVMPRLRYKRFKKKSICQNIEIPGTGV